MCWIMLCERVVTRLEETLTTSGRWASAVTCLAGRTMTSWAVLLNSRTTVPPAVVMAARKAAREPLLSGTPLTISCSSRVAPEPRAQ